MSKNSNERGKFGIQPRREVDSTFTCFKTPKIKFLTTVYYLATSMKNSQIIHQVQKPHQAGFSFPLCLQKLQAWFFQERVDTIMLLALVENSKSQNIHTSQDTKKSQTFFRLTAYCLAISGCHVPTLSSIN